MSLRNTVWALPTLIRVNFASAVAYRAEMLVWILSTTMPLIMLALWSTVAREAPIGGFGEGDFVAYFLATFIVRQLTGSWAAWEINFEVRGGTLSARLLRPVNPIVCYAIENLCALPLRLVVALPLAIAALLAAGTAMLPDSAGGWFMALAAIIGGWAITFLVNVAIGSLAVFMESSEKLMDVWFAGFLVFSGYLIPVELFPDTLRAISNALPFRYQIGLPVELLTSRHGPSAALELLLYQWSYVAVLLLVVVLTWRAAVRRYAAYGG